PCALIDVSGRLPIKNLSIKELATCKRFNATTGQAIVQSDRPTLTERISLFTCGCLPFVTSSVSDA
ncbi:MAG: hypothetical protein ACK53G_00080, partial [Armatimonadota bacterium]